MEVFKYSFVLHIPVLFSSIYTIIIALFNSNSRKKRKNQC
ncbi:hypothetical protein PNI0006_01271 [Streptococcus pneumoniae PNI0006]|nr:hypothetical protein PNI0006_01271 [Streptococcus pneumoniae PNI0006]